MRGSRRPAAFHHSRPHGASAIDPVELLQALIRFETVNPPGNERRCIDFVARVFTDAGLSPKVIARDPERPNLVVRLSGRGEAPPLLLYGHVDVVNVEGQRWRHPPFSGHLQDGHVWGRGAIDMKGGLAMMIAAMLRAKSGGLAPAGDVIFAAVSDEEAGSEFGARFLTEEHADLFSGVRYALGEVGGAAVHVSGRRFYPIMVAEKQSCVLRLTFRGPSGHGSFAPRGGAMAQMAEAVRRMERHRLPVHVTPAPRMMLRAMSEALPPATRAVFNLLTRPILTDRILNVLGPRGAAFDPMLHNTVTPTIVRAGVQHNVVPAEVKLELDGRILPGCTPDDLIREVRDVLGASVSDPDGPHIEVVHYSDGPGEPDMGLFDLLVGVLREADPDGTPAPILIPGTTDARWFSRLGIQTYGFTPMNLPPGLDFASLFHGENERIPVTALHFGTTAIHRVLERYGTG